MRSSSRLLLLFAMSIAALPSWAQPKCPGCSKVGGSTYELAINKVTPESAIEHTAISVEFTLTRKAVAPQKEPSSVSGRVCPADASGDCASNDNITFAVPWTGTVQVKAPTSGDKLTLLFCLKNRGEDTGCGPGFETNNVAMTYPSKASYEVLIESFEIVHTKARMNDSVWASLFGKTGAPQPPGSNAAPIAAPSTESDLCHEEGGVRYCAEPKYQGTRVNGVSTSLGDMRVGPFLLAPETDEQLVFWFVFMNAGFSENEKQYLKMMGMLNMFGAGIFSSLMSTQGGGSSSSTTNQLKEATDNLNTTIVADCDGVVVNDYRRQLNKTVEGVEGGSLEARTRELGFYRGGNSSDARDTYITDNPGECGDKAIYKVTWRIARTSWQPPFHRSFPAAPVSLARVTDDASPQYCPHNSAITALKCTGRYCDDIHATCTPFGFDSPRGHRDADAHKWSSWYSEEGTGLPGEVDTTKKTIQSSGFITGLECRGKYCDDLRVDSDAEGIAPTDECSWLPAISEETGPAQCPVGQYVGNIQCKGSYCDNLRVQCCSVRH